jgi:hypothetical protein
MQLDRLEMHWFNVILASAGLNAPAKVSSADARAVAAINMVGARMSSSSRGSPAAEAAGISENGGFQATARSRARSAEPMRTWVGYA